MNIALVIERFEPSRGGREKSTAQIASGLVRRGHRVTVLCRKGRATEGALEVRPLGGGGLLRAAALKRFVAAVGAQIRDRAFDIVHAMLPVPGCNVYQPRGGTVPAQAAASQRRRGALGGRAAALLGRWNLHRKAMGSLERVLVGDGNVLCLAVSDMVAQEFATYYSRSHNVRVIYNGVDVPDPDSEQRATWRQEVRYRLGMKQTDPLFLTVTRNFALKGVRETIFAVERWIHRRRPAGRPQFVFVGSGTTEGYQRIAGGREIGRNVHFVEPTDEIFRFYAAADVCVLLSWYDPCSRVVLEATRWGIPSITTTFNGAAEVLARGAGVVVQSPRDINAVVAALDELADEHRRADRAAACRRVEAELSMDRHVEQLLDAYATLLRR